MSFQNFELHPLLLKGIQACGFESPTEIQQNAIPAAIEGNDLIATAQTGTGKTAAFVIPALQHLSQLLELSQAQQSQPKQSQQSQQPQNRPKRPQARKPQILVLTPTRELATQVSENIQQLGKFMRIRYVNIVGGVPYPPQIRSLSQPLDIIVATPGRLIDHIENGRADLSQVKIFVLDEADRMLDMGFVNDVETIAKQLPKQRQTLFFSATFEAQVQKIAKKLLINPVKIELTHAYKQHQSIKQCVLQADNYGHKHVLLKHILRDENLKQALVFTATKRSAQKLSEQLNERGYKSAALHGDMKQSARKRTVEQMKKNRVQILVATDVASRGLDIKTITHVINFDLPPVAEDYVHRIGRTGRAGLSGLAFSLVGPNDWAYLSEIEKFMGSKIPQTTFQGLEPRLAKPSISTKKNFKTNKKRTTTIKHKRPTQKLAPLNSD